MKKTVAFKCHTPYTMFISAIIAEVYYKEYKHILITSKFFMPSRKKQIEQSGIFDAVYCFDESKKDVEGVKNQVNKFYVENKLEALFVCALDDPYSVMLMYRAGRKTHIYVYPEGSSTMMLQEKLEIVDKEVYGKNKEHFNFFRKYPLKLEQIEKLWLFNKRMYFGKTKFLIEQIEMKELFCQNSLILKRINKLFNYTDEIKYESNVFYLDDYLVERNWLYGDAEQKIIDEIGFYLKEKKMYVKPHVGQNLDFVKSKFRDLNISLIRQYEIPWEVFFLNIMAENKFEEYIFISPIISTAIYSSLMFNYNKKKIIILSFIKYFTRYETSYLRNADSLNQEYIFQVKNIYNDLELYVPENNEKIEEACKKIFSLDIPFEKKDELILYNNRTHNYFCRMGNLYECALLQDEKGRLYKAFYDFVTEDVTIRFDFPEIKRDRILQLVVSEGNLFSCIDQMKIYIRHGKRDKQVDFSLKQGIGLERIYIGDNEILQIELCIDQEYNSILVKGALSLKDTFSSLSQKNNLAQWKLIFYENWLVVVQSDCLKNYVTKNKIKCIGVFGDGKIGVIVKQELEKNGVKVFLIASKGKKVNDIKVFGLDELKEIASQLDLIIITPMQDYYEVFFKITCKTNIKIIEVNTFAEEVVKSDE